MKTKLSHAKFVVIKAAYIKPKDCFTNQLRSSEFVSLATCLVATENKHVLNHIPPRGYIFAVNTWIGQQRRLVMNRIFYFILGIALGVVGHHTALNYHVVRAEDGVHFIPKISSGLNETYVDIRSFDLADWHNHKTLAAAIVRAEKPNLLRNTKPESLQSATDEMIAVPRNS